MNTGAMVESTDRRAKDFFHFGLTVLGIVLGIAGTIILSWKTVVCGLVLIFLGLLYFEVED